MVTYFNFLLPAEVNGANQARIRAVLSAGAAPTDNGRWVRSNLRMLESCMARLGLPREHRADMRSSFYGSLRQGADAYSAYVGAVGMVERKAWATYCSRQFVGPFGQAICTQPHGHQGKCYGRDASGITRHFGEW